MGSWIEASHQKDHTMIRILELSAPPPFFEQGLETELMIKKGYTMKPP